MNSGQYLATHNQIFLLGQLVLRIPLAEFLNAISMADTLGPLIEPTLYRQGASGMHRVETLARAAKKFQDELRDIYAGDDELRPALEKINEELSAATGERRCRICGCTEENPCELEDGPCSWVEEDLCSNPACMKAAGYEED